MSEVIPGGTYKGVTVIGVDNGSGLAQAVSSSSPFPVETVPLSSDGRKVVTTAGTRVALAASTAIGWVSITAETDNTGVIVVGGSTVVAALATRRGKPLSAGEDITLPADNLANVYIDSTVNGDGVTFIYG